MSCSARAGPRRRSWPVTASRSSMRSRVADVTVADVNDSLVIAGERFTSRLIMGTGGAPSLDVLERALDASGTQIVTVALRRLDPAGASSFLDVVAQGGRRILPNTAGCFTAHDAITTARLAREAFETNWIKLEVIAD